MSEADRVKYGLPPGPVPIAADPAPKEATTPMAKHLTDAEKESLKFDLQRSDMTQRSLSLKYGVAQSVVSYYAGLVKTLPESMSDVPRDADEVDTSQDIGREDDDNAMQKAETPILANGRVRTFAGTLSRMENDLMAMQVDLMAGVDRLQQRLDEVQRQLDAVSVVKMLAKDYDL